MAANLTPQYMEAEEKYKLAKTAEEKLEWLREMYKLIPKHKASEKLQADLKTRISETKKDIERDKQSTKKSGVSYKIPKQGAGQFTLVGAPNSGKSALLAALTKAKPEVAEYPFTTRAPQAGMMEWEDVRVQLIDLPPITADFLEGWVSSMIRSSDAALLVVDLGNDDGPFEAEAALERLAGNKTHLVGHIPEEDPDEDPGIMHVRTMILANKADHPDGEAALDILKEMFEDRFRIYPISVETGDGLDRLRETMFRFLEQIRIYTKQPGKPADKTNPFTCHRGSTIVDVAGMIHKDLAEKVKSARVWGSRVHDGQSVGKEYELNDQDVVELQV